MEKTKQHARDVFTLTAHSDAEAADLAAYLLDQSQYFAVIPLPDDEWSIEVTEIPPGLSDPAAAAEVKAIAGQLDAGVDADDVELGPGLTEAKMIAPGQWRKLPLAQPKVEPDPDAGLIGSDQFRPQRGIPAHMHAALIGYVERGEPVGSFLASVLANDFVQALTRCDDDNRAAIDEWVELLRGHLPSPSWGSREAVAAWQKQGGLKGGR